jgi:hypothetical protein
MNIVTKSSQMTTYDHLGAFGDVKGTSLMTTSLLAIPHANVMRVLRSVSSGSENMRFTERDVQNKLALACLSLSEKNDFLKTNMHR